VGEDGRDRTDGNRVNGVNFVITQFTYVFKFIRFFDFRLNGPYNDKVYGPLFFWGSTGEETPGRLDRLRVIRTPSLAFSFV
jgi:hypothetical protein